MFIFARKWDLSPLLPPRYRSLNLFDPRNIHTDTSATSCESFIQIGECRCKCGTFSKELPRIELTLSSLHHTLTLLT